MKKNSLGVIIGRFQSPYIHNGYEELFKHVTERHKNVLVLIGITQAIGTKRDPLSYVMRFNMVHDYLKKFPNMISIDGLNDTDNDKTWSENVDHTIKNILKYYSLKGAILYGGRDSFVSHYLGKFKIQKFVNKNSNTSSTEIRNKIGLNPVNTTDFRSGVIHSVQTQYPKVFMTVDIAITREKNGETFVLLGQKKGSKALRFPGGFVDPTDRGLREAAGRELQEEAPNIDIGDYYSLRFVSSSLIEDYRYRGPEKIMTALFHAPYSFGNTKAGDDLEHLGWYPLLDEKTVDKVYLPHHGLYVDLVHYLEKMERANEKEPVVAD